MTQFSQDSRFFDHNEDLSYLQRPVNYCRLLETYNESKIEHCQGVIFPIKSITIPEDSFQIKRVFTKMIIFQFLNELLWLVGPMKNLRKTNHKHFPKDELKKIHGNITACKNQNL